MASLRFKARALTIATAGILSMSPISMVSRGLLQLPVHVDVEVVQSSSRPGGGISEHIYYQAPNSYSNLSEPRFIIDSETFSRLENVQPITVEKIEKPSVLAYISRGELRILSQSVDMFDDSTWRKQQNEEIILLAAARLLWRD